MPWIKMKTSRLPCHFLKDRVRPSRALYSPSDPLIISAITTKKSLKTSRDKFGIPIVFFICFEFIALTLTVYIRYRDACSSGIMDATATNRVIIRERLEDEAKAAKAAKAAEASAQNDLIV